MKHAFPQISPMALRHLLAGDTNVTLIDVRSPAEYRSGHIPGAQLTPLEEIERQRLSSLAADAGSRADNPIYLTCHAGARAEQAAQALYKAGLRHLVLLEGGTEAWQKQGLDLAHCNNALSIERQVQIAVGSLLIVKVFFGFTVHELFFVVGAIIGAGLITAGLTRWCGMARLIARMPWNTATDCGQQAKA